MNILVDIGHPGHVHFYKHAIKNWRAKGLKVLITARDKDVTLALLQNYGLAHCVISQLRPGQFGLALEFIEHEWQLGHSLRRFRPDVVTAIGGVFIAPLSKLLDIPSVVFTDSEHVALDRYLSYPLASVICTPNCFKKEIGKNQLRYYGFQELAYLSPKYFIPDPTALSAFDIIPQDPFTLLRFVAWEASHDVGHTGFTMAQKRALVHELGQYGRVFISAEGNLPQEFETHRIAIRPDKIHDLLYYASLYVGEGATMATEAGLLGTPAVYVSSLVGTMGNYEALAEYGLVEAYQQGARGVQRAIELAQDPQSKLDTQNRRQSIIQDMIDVTTFITETVETYGRGETLQS